jgi:transcriptional regulator with XRE-family HTH domain
MARAVHSDLAADLTERAVEFGQRLKASRNLSGKKVKELAQELGWDPHKVYRLEAGAQIPDALELADYAAATGVDIDFFYGASPDGSGDRRTLSGAGAKRK